MRFEFLVFLTATRMALSAAICAGLCVPSKVAAYHPSFQWLLANSFPPPRL